MRLRPKSVSVVVIPRYLRTPDLGTRRAATDSDPVRADSGLCCLCSLQSKLLVRCGPLVGHLLPKGVIVNTEHASNSGHSEVSELAGPPSDSHQRQARVHPSIGRALSLDDEAEVIVRCLKGDISRVDAAAELNVTAATVRHRIARFIEAGASGLQQTRSARTPGHSDGCSNLTAHVLGEMVVRLAEASNRTVLGNCNHPAIHALGERELADAAEGRVPVRRARATGLPLPSSRTGSRIPD